MADRNVLGLVLGEEKASREETTAASLMFVDTK
jgi:hypothetical protein